MISVNNLSVHFSGYYLFKNITFNLNDKDRIGLTGKNGAGKSTLLKILSGQQEAESGAIVIGSGQSIGYLPQEMIPNSSRTVLDEALTAFDHIIELENKIKTLTQEISEREDYESEDYAEIINCLHELTERFHMFGGNNRQEESEKVLLGLGFLHSDFNRSIAEFSTGWQMRVELAKILLKRPHFILLDEPTNHLDIESIQWLENFLINYFGCVVLVSHDRTFLDKVTKRTIEINSGKIYDYKVSYSEYVHLLEERIQNQQSAFDNQQRQIAEVEKFIERFRYKATKARQVQSRVKMLEKIDRVQIDDIDMSSIHFQFPQATQSGKIVAELISLSKSYGAKKILSNIDLLISRGDRIAFVGRNGEGKSTLSKILMGEITDYGGEYKNGHQVKMGYYAQNQAALLNGEKTVFETIDDIAEGDIRPKIRSILGGFLFGGEDIDKKVKSLSGGEKARLALAKLLLTPSNLLLLDEPTNHLDIQSKDVLKHALLQYTGTLIVVSHDRDFLQGLTNTVYEFKNQKIKRYVGDIFEFLESRELESLHSLELNKKEALNKAKEVSENKLKYEKAKESDKEIRKIKKRVEQLEEEIRNLEKQIAEKDDLLANSSENVSFDLTFYSEYESLKKSLEKTMSEWEAEFLKLESI